MELIVNDDKTIDDVTSNEILENINNLNFGEFIILAKSSDHYIQAYYSQLPNESNIEYRDGYEIEHYQAAIVDKILLGEAFNLYFNNDESFKNTHAWEKLEIDESDFLDDEQEDA